MDTNTATITRTTKGFALTFPWGVANIGAAYTHAVLYTSGGWNGETNANDLPTFSKHKSDAAARKEAVKYAAANGATFTIVDLATVQA